MILPQKQPPTEPKRSVENVTTNGAGRRGADPYRGKGYADEILLTVGRGFISRRKNRQPTPIGRSMTKALY